jgi:hypothetical protein
MKETSGPQTKPFIHTQSVRPFAVTAAVPSSAGGDLLSTPQLRNPSLPNWGSLGPLPYISLSSSSIILLNANHYFSSKHQGLYKFIQIHYLF